MNKKIAWLPGVLVIIGGLYTAIIMFLEMQDAEKRFDNAEHGFAEIFTGLLKLLSGVFLFPMFIGIIAIFVGIFMTVRQPLFLPFISLFLSMMLMNWIGFIIMFTGSILAFVIWNKQDPVDPYLTTHDDSTP